MSWLFSRALVAEYSAASCSDGGQSAPLSVMPTRRRFWRNDKMMEYSSRSLSGLTCQHFTASRGMGLLMSYLAAFPVRTSVQPGKAQESPAVGRDSGSKWPASFARLDRDSSTWKTPQCSLLGVSMLSSVTWPRSGSMRNGVCFRRPALAPHTSGKGSGLLPTPVASHSTHSGPNQSQGGRPGLQMAAMMWPTPNVPNGGRRVPPDAEIKGGLTPTAYKNGKKMQVGLEQAVIWFPTPHGFSKDGKSNGPSGNELGRAVNRSMLPTPRNSTGADCSKKHLNLGGYVRMFPTPCAQDSQQAGSKNAKHLTLHRKIMDMPGESPGGSLNPTWVEWLMGWPLGWTDLKPLEMDKFLWWLQQHSGSCLNEPSAVRQVG